MHVNRLLSGGAFPMGCSLRVEGYDLELYLIETRKIVTTCVSVIAPGHTPIFWYKPVAMGRFFLSPSQLNVSLVHQSRIASIGKVGL